MNGTMQNRKNFIGYEYKEVSVSRDMEGVYADAYPNFGWQLDGSEASALGLSTINLKFKRDCKIRNKAELTRLQRQFESNALEMRKLEQSKTGTARIAALITGLIGTGFMAGSVFAVTANIIPLCVVFAIPGFMGWGLSGIIFNKIKTKRAEAIAPLIEQKYDMIYKTCEKAYALLA